MEAESLFIKRLNAYPTVIEVIPLCVLCMVALQKKDEALQQLLLRLIATNPSTEAIKAYQAILSGYIKRYTQYPLQSRNYWT